MRIGIFKTNRFIQLTNFGTTTRALVLTGALIIGMVVLGFSQQQPGALSISGTISYAGGKSLPDASVRLRGGNAGTTTDKDGKFSIQVPARGGVLLISHVGFVSTEYTVSDNSPVMIELAPTKAAMDSVVVVGYGTQKKVNLTGAVDVISGEALQNRPSASIAQLLQGQSANLNIDVSTHGGEPGAPRNWNIRGLGSINGSSSPLILIDGVEGNVEDLDPESVQSVSVLKDASASAIYGSRAPFGVVLITTKKGTKGRGVKISYNSNYAWASPIRLPHFADSYTWATAFNEAQSNEGLAPIYPDEQMDRIKGYIAGTYKTEYDPANPPQIIWNGRWQGNANYDWPGLFFRKNSLSVKQNVNLEGGDDRTQYFVSAGYYNQGGLYNWGNDSYKRYNLMANLTSKVTDWFRFDFGARYAQATGDYPLGVVDQVRQYNLRSIFSFAPMTPMYNIDGTLSNPIEVSFMNSGRETTTTNDLWLKIGGELEPIKGWKTDISYNYNLVDTNDFQNPKPVPVNIPNGTLGNIGSASAGVVENLGTTNYFLFNALTSYEKNLGKHFAKLMVGYEEELNKYQTLYGSKMDLITPDVPSISTATGTTTLGDTRGHWATQAVFGRFNYNYAEKFLFEFSGRYNGSSRFAANSRWGFFPSASAGYNISKEKFWDPIAPIVKTLKIRGSYGSLGNQNVPNYLSVSTIPVSSNLNYVIDGTRPVYALIPAILPSNLTWETVTTGDIGLDAGLLKDRLNVTFDVYQRTTSNMFGPAQDLPAILGTAVPYENNAEMRTRGFEVSLDWKDQIGAHFNYHVRLTVGDNKSIITKYLNTNKTIDNWYAGKTNGEIWGFQSDRLIQTQGEQMPDQSEFYATWGPGDMKYKDLNGDGKVTDGSRTIADHGDLKVIGNTSPRYAYGFNAGFDWKNFSFNMFWQGVLKRDYFPDRNANVFWGIIPGGSPGSESSIMKGSPALNYWRPQDETNFLGPNTNAYFPKPYFDYDEFMKNHQYQSRYVLNAAYLRLKNLQLGYTIPTALARKAFIKNIRIYLSGENLITITKLPKVLDPETVFTSDAALGGIEATGLIYPLQRSFSCGLNITF